MGFEHPELGAFGIAHPKEAPRQTTDQLAERAEKVRQTRARNHTMGKRQKQALKKENDAASRERLKKIEEDLEALKKDLQKKKEQ